MESDPKVFFDSIALSIRSVSGFPIAFGRKSRIRVTTTMEGTDNKCLLKPSSLTTVFLSYLLPYLIVTHDTFNNHPFKNNFVLIVHHNLTVVNLLIMMCSFSSQICGDMEFI